VRLFRPVGLGELALIWDSGLHDFPPRLPHQPIFYPVADVEYARQIAREWNTKESSFAGYVTEFEIADSYISAFERHIVGAAHHAEFWIPAEELSNFNHAIQEFIRVVEGYFGTDFKGWIPEQFGIRGNDAVSQFVTLTQVWEYNRVDFAREVTLNRKAVFLNFLFWKQFDFMEHGVDQQRKTETLRRLAEAWTFTPCELPVPGIT
jgi:hypothetical protein